MSRRGLVVAVAAVALAVAVAATVFLALDRSPSQGRAPRASAPVTSPPVRGGSVRVGMWAEPDPAAPTLAGAGVRSLTLPQLFMLDPEGRWQPWLVEPGSVGEAPDLSSARFRLRAGARWSDGSEVTADDLRRSADPMFVAGVDGPDGSGVVTVRFTQRLPGWRRLWSGTASVAAPRPGLWGGPFVVAARVPGLETVLHRNPSWWGAPAPHLDEVRLVLVPDPVTARQLFERGELDVVMPPAATVRTEQLRHVPGASVAVGGVGGWAVELLLNDRRLDARLRNAVVAAVPRRSFVDGLLRGEAEVGVGAEPPSAAEPSAFSGRTVQLSGQVEEPMTLLLQRAMQRRGNFELRNAEAERVERWVGSGDYDAAVTLTWSPPPAEACWRCRWGRVDDALARRADEGDASAVAALAERIRGDPHAVELWRSRAVVAWRARVAGVRANPWALNGAWGSWEWSLR